MEDEYKEPSAEEEIAQYDDILIKLFTATQSKYEDISKLLTGLASGALVLSVTLISRGSIRYWFVLLLSWVFFMISIWIGVVILRRMYTLYRNRCQELKKLTQTAKEKIEKAHAERKVHGRLILGGTLLAEIKSAMLAETEEQPAGYQFWTFMIGSVLLFVFGIVNL
jgi:hypothetical protein